MAINIADSFNRTTAQPPFTGMVFNDIPARNAYLQTLRYQGMECFVISDATYYSLKAGITNGDWEARSSGEVAALDVDFIPTSEILSTDVQSAIEEVQANLMNVGDIVDHTISVPTGGTTGQILGKTSNLDGAIAWQNPPVTSPLTTKGDIYGHDGSVGVRIPVGTNGQVLTADSAETTGLKWTNMIGSNPTVQSLANAAVMTLPTGLIKMVKVVGSVYPCVVSLPAGTVMGEQLFVEGTSDAFPVNVANLFEVYTDQVGHAVWNGTAWLKVGGV